MENLTPPLLEATRELRWRVVSGHSMRESLRLYLDVATTPFAQQLREWWTIKAQNRNATPDAVFTTCRQQALIELIERGLSGEPTLEHLTALEQEITLAAEAEVEAHLASLPFKVLLPLLAFQFPAFLLLLLGPMLRELTQKMGG